MSLYRARWICGLPSARCYQDKLWSWMSEPDQDDFLNIGTRVSTVSNVQARESEPKMTFQDINDAWAELCKTVSPQTAMLNIDKYIL